MQNSKGHTSIQVTRSSKLRPVSIQFKIDGKTIEFELTEKSAFTFAGQLIEAANCGTPTRSEYKDEEVGLLDQTFNQIDKMFKTIFGSKK